MAFENLQPLTYAVISVAFAIGCSSIFLRIYCRIRLMTWGWDDAVALFLLLINAFQQAIMYIFLYYGCGLHRNELSERQLSSLATWLFIEEIFYMFVHWTIKQAFLLFYLRLSIDISFRRMVYGTMVLNTMVLITNWLLAFLQCDPFQALFNRAAYPYAKCLDPYIVNMLPIGLNIMTDLIILFLPIPMVLSLNMSKKQKVSVLAVICFGATAVMTAFFRFYIQKEMIDGGDISYTLAKMVIVTIIEIQSATVAVNLPALKALFTKFKRDSQQRKSKSSSVYPFGYKTSSLHPSRCPSQGGSSYMTHSRDASDAGKSDLEWWQVDLKTEQQEGNWI